MWCSSSFSHSAWSATPGVVFRPFNSLSLGWTGIDWFATHEFGKVEHRFGIAFRPIAPVTFSVGNTTKDFNAGWLDRAPMFARVDFHAKNFEVSVAAPVHAADTTPWALTLGIPLGSYQTAYAEASRSDLLNVGVAGHFARSPQALAMPTWVRLKLDKDVVETHSGFLFMSDDAISLPDLRRQFVHLANDPSVQGVIIDFEGYKGHSAVGSEIRRGIASLRRHGKHTIAYLTELRASNYLAASAAERVVLQPSARVHLRGLSGEVLHYKGLLDMVGIKVELLRHGRYKAAVEPFTQDTMSAEARADMEALLGSLWKTLRDTIAVSRHISADSIEAIAHLSPLIASDAKALGLVDSVMYFDELERKVEPKQIFASVPTWRFQSSEPYSDAWNRKARVAVITIEGDIVDGLGGRSFPSGSRTVGDQTYSELAERLAHTPGISAIVLRINSPGGSAQASDIIWHQLRDLRVHSHLPVVASIGGMAASGGYYIACSAEKIIAEPTSLVGSIGVFGGKLDVSGLYAKLHINSSVVKTHANADAESYSRPFTEEEKKILQVSMDDTYQRFLGVVADARAKTKAGVDSMGEGRVFTGVQGLANGLVDSLGGLDLAVRVAADLAGVSSSTEVEAVHLSFDNNWRTEFSAFGNAVSTPWSEWLQSLEEPQVWTRAWFPNVEEF